MIKNQILRHRLLPILSMVLLLSLFFSGLPGSLQHAAAAAQKPVCKYSYTVRSGDTLNIIAKKYNVDVTKLVEANPLGEKRWIYVLQSLCIPSGKAVYNSKVPGWTNNLAGDYTAKRVGKYVVITTTNFPKNNAYYVKVGKPTAALNEMKKLGMFKTGEKKNPSSSYALPNNLRLESLKVCLKENALTRNNICRSVTR